jgi:hypothetical protein
MWNDSAVTTLPEGSCLGKRVGTCDPSVLESPVCLIRRSVNWRRPQEQTITQAGTDPDQLLLKPPPEFDDRMRLVTEGRSPNGQALVVTVNDHQTNITATRCVGQVANGILRP